jgi:hypothetical protein
MKLRHAIGALTLVIVPAIAIFGQLATTENPFPETGQQEDDAIFQTSTMGLLGVITQRVSRADHSPAYFFFRIQVTQGRVTTAWTIRIEPNPRLLNIAKNCGDCLINEYPPDILKNFDVGKTVVVKGYQSRKSGDHRLLAKEVNIVLNR